MTEEKTQTRPKLKELYSLQEGVEYLDIEETHLTNAARQNKTIIPLKLGNKYFVTKRMLDAWMEGYLFGKRQDANPYWPVEPTKVEQDAFLSSGDLYKKVNAWLKENSYKAVSFRSFGHQITKSDIPRKEEPVVIFENTEDVLMQAVYAIINRPGRGRQLGWQAES